MSVRKALIVGCAGQDGTLLRLSLLANNIETIGISRNAVIRYSLNFTEDIYKKNLEVITNGDELKKIIKEFKPTEIYYLAAHHTSSEIIEPESADEYIKCNNTHVIGLINILNLIRDQNIQAKLFYASSALVFSGNNVFDKINESSPLAPIGYYGLTKAQGALICEHYRRKYGIYASVGHLFNHESHLRQPHYLSHKIISTAYRISKGEEIKLTIGNLKSINDWGYANDFIEAFQKIIMLERPESFIISTGEGNTVEEFVSRVFDYFKLDYKNYLMENESIQIRKTGPRVGDPSKILRATGWQPSCNFSEMIKKLIIDHIKYYEAKDFQLD
jgi:GDPmannose 4,6-dehydratase